MKPKIQWINDSSRARNSEETMYVRRVIPHHRANAVTGPQAEPRQSRSKSPGAAVKISEGGTRRRAPGASRQNFRASKQKPGTIEQVWERQREIHHRAAHARTS